MKRWIFALLTLAPLPVPAAEPQAVAPQAAAPEPENALKYLQQANEAFKPYTYTNQGGNLKQPTGADARRIVAENAAVFPLLERAAALPLSIKINTVQDTLGEGKILRGMRDAVRLLALRCSVQTEAGDFAGALHSALLCVALGGKTQEGSLIGAFSSYSVEGTGLVALEKAALRWDAATLKAAARGLGELEARRPALSVMLAAENKFWAISWRTGFQERALTVNGYDKATQDRLIAAQREVSEEDDELFTHGFPYTRGQDFEREEDEPVNYFPAVDANFDARAWAESHQKSARSVKQGALFKRTRVQAQSALLQAALAARAYQIEKKTLPASLQVLVPEYLPAVPVDPFSEDVLRFKNDADGLSIYSVGPDGLDDGGKPLPDGGVDIHSLGDISAPSELLKL